jgi:hypothetical protein
MTLASASARVDTIRRSLVSLKMPRALEILDATLRRIEQGQIDVASYGTRCCGGVRA